MIPTQASHRFRSIPATPEQGGGGAVREQFSTHGTVLLQPQEFAMPGQRLPMRQVREVLRLKHLCSHSGRQIAAAIGVSRYTVAEYLRRAGVIGITWPVPPELDDATLERRLFVRIDLFQDASLTPIWSAPELQG